MILFWRKRALEPLGRQGESVAARHLKRAGYKILTKNADGQLETQPFEEESAESAVNHVNEGLELIRESFADMGWEDQFEGDELVQRLIQLRDSLCDEYSIGKSLRERLADAVATEQYELAARLRDELTRRSEN